MSSVEVEVASEPDTESIGYRAVLRLAPHTDAIELAERHVRVWLRDKVAEPRSVDHWDGESSQDFDASLSLRVTSRDDEQSEIHRRLFRIVDQNAAGRFTVSVFAATPPGGQSGALVVEASLAGASRDEAMATIGTPRIVREVLNEVTAVDGDTPITGAPIRVRTSDVGTVVDSILDEDRQISVIVASSVDRQVDERWARIVAKLTRNSVGVAAVYAIDADAVAELNKLLPPSHAVPPGLVRTFAPAVDLSDPEDGRIHRFLGPQTLARSIRGEAVVGRLPGVHARAPRLRLLERSLPADVRRAVSLLKKEERKERLETEVARRVKETTDTVTGTATVVLPPLTMEGAGEAREPEADELRGLSGVVGRLRAMVARWLGHDASTVTTEHIGYLDHLLSSKFEESRVAAEYVEEVEEANKSLEDEIAELRELLDERELSAAAIAAELRSESTANQRLKSQLRQHHVFHIDADPDSDQWEAPADVEELVTWLTPGEGEHNAQRWVVFTGDSSAVSEVRKRDSYGTYAASIWDYVRVLFEYAEARASGYAGNVHMYLADEDVPGFKCSTQRHASRESDTVRNNAKWAQERVFPLPEGVGESAMISMEAHFKPTHRDQFAPRVHYYDDTSGTGKIYVGYIGRHLTNTRT